MTAAAQANNNKRTPYPERWQAFSVEDRARVAGDEQQAAVMDEFLQAISEMSEEDRAELTDTLLRELETVKARLEATEAHLGRLRRRRTLTFVKLLLAGATQAAVATKAGVSSMVVSYDTGIATKQR